MRDDLHSPEALVGAGFNQDEARYLISHPETCPTCAHLMIFHDDAHGDEYPTYCSVDECDCVTEPT